MSSARESISRLSSLRTRRSERLSKIIEWQTQITGWHWIGPDGWEIIRSVRNEDNATQFVIFHNNATVDFRATLSVAKLTAESEMTRTTIN